MYTTLRYIPKIAVLVIAMLAPQVALACPTCKDSLTENYVQAYGMSIIFMMSMPFIIFAALSGYFYYEVRKARRQQQLGGRGSGRAEQLDAADDVLGSAGASPSP